MFQDSSKLKARIAKHQLALILAACFSEQEMMTLADKCGIRCEERVHSSSKDWLIQNLVTIFFEQALTEDTVSRSLAQKAQSAAHRVGYMDVKEIKTFLRSVSQLLEDGEFGEIVWALLMDSREDARRHGYQLLVEYEPLTPFREEVRAADQRVRDLESDALQERDGANVDAEQTIEPPHHNGDEGISSESMNSSDISPHFHVEPAAGWLNNERAARSYDADSLSQEVQGSPAKVDFDASLLLAAPAPIHREAASAPSDDFSVDAPSPQQSEKIHQLHEEIHNIKREYIAVQNENNRLRQQLEQFIVENQALQQMEHQNRENELHIHQLERENRTLKYDLQRLSDQLGEFHKLKLEKVKLATELKVVDDAVYRSQQAIEQMKSDFHAQLVGLQRANEESRTALTRTQQKIAHLVGHPNGVVNHIRMIGQPRVGVFVDVQNMFYAAKDRYAGRLDYIKLLDLIVGPRKLIVAYAYVVQIPEINQAGFLSLLEHNGYTIKSKDLRMRGDGSAKGDWDVGIAIDVVSMLDALDVVVLASGDGDFCALADMIKQQGKRVEVAAFAHNTSMDLQRMADQFFPIGDDLLI